MQLKQGALLQGGKYRIERMLGQGGFGITYLAMQDLLDRKVAIKEFFFKEYCEREGDTNTITLGTQSNKPTVERFLKKFIKEAKTISSLHHPNIIQIHDIFCENNTAYYVMEYIEGISLGEMVKTHGALPESKAVAYIRKTANALAYIHERNINHLDVKPNNIMFRSRDGEIVLIDFGVAKQYDETTKEGTTTTPVGISHGFSPPEQYKHNGVSTFSPESDIYSLGATLFKLVTGITPPEAIEIAQEGLPKMSSSISDACQAVIRKSMLLNKTNRPRNIVQFIEILDTQKEPEIIVEVVKEETVIPDSPAIKEVPQIPVVEKKNEIHNTSNTTSNSPIPPKKQETIQHNNIKKTYDKFNLAIVMALCIILSCIGYLFRRAEDKERISNQEISQSDVFVKRFEYKNSNGELLYYWTGKVNGAGKPFQKGTAVYPSNDKDGRKSYVGEMIDGLRMDDNATLTYTNGNVYKGSFYKDMLSIGRLDLITDGMYYIGTFKNDMPYNGKWYYTNGNLYSTVTNGTEK